MDEFGIRLKNLRSLAGESQKQLAESLQVSDVMISQYENGKKMPSLATMKNIAEHYNVPLSNLLDGPESGQSDEIIVLNMALNKMPLDKQRKVLAMTKLMFEEYFTDSEEAE